MAISVGSVAVDVVPDTRTFAEQLKAKLKGITADIAVTADTAGLREKLVEVSRDLRATIQVDADTAAAEAQIDSAARDRTANVRVNSSGFAGATAGVSGLTSAILTLGPALIPITAAVAALGAALAAPVAAAGGGLTVFGVIAGVAVKDTNKQIKQIDDLRKKMDDAKAALATASAGSRTSAANASASAQRSAANANAAAIRSAENSIAAARASAAAATTPAARAAALRRVTSAEASLAARQASIHASLASRSASIQASASATQAAAQAKLTEATTEYKNALDALTPAQKKFMDSKLELKASFKELVQAAGPAVFGPLVQGMDLLAGVLPKLKPLLKPVSDAIGTLLSDLGGFAKGAGFKAFVAGFGKSAASAIVTFGRIFGNVTRGMFGLFRAFGALSGPFVKGLADLAQSFANFGRDAGQNKGLQSFIAYMREAGPKVAATFGHLIQAVVKIGEALAPLGGLVLTLVDGLAQLIARATPAQLAAIAGAIGAIGLAIGVATGGISLVVPLLVGLGAGVAYAYAHFKPFRDVVNAVGGFLRDNLLPALRDAGETVMPALKQAFSDVSGTVRDNQGLLKALGDVFKLIGGYLVKVWIPTMAMVATVVIPALVKSFQGAVLGLRLLGNAWLGQAQIGVQAFRILAIMALTAFGDILRGAARAFGWIPGIGPKIKAASGAFDEFRAQTIANLNKTAAKIRAVQDALNGIKPKPIILDVITRTHAQAKVDRQLGVPRGATGGIVTRPTLAVIGEAGPEAVVPLNRTPGSHPLAGGSQEIRGTLSLDPRGVATIHGVARDAVASGRKQREATALHSAMGSESFQ